MKTNSIWRYTAAIALHTTMLATILFTAPTLKAGPINFVRLREIVLPSMKALDPSLGITIQHLIRYMLIYEASTEKGSFHALRRATNFDEHVRNTQDNFEQRLHIIKKTKLTEVQNKMQDVQEVRKAFVKYFNDIPQQSNQFKHERERLRSKVINSNVNTND